MKNDVLIHKETFFQRSYDGVPSHWVVQYWEGSPNGFAEANYFKNRDDAAEFEKELVIYDDWLTSQEIPLHVQ